MTAQQSHNIARNIARKAIAPVAALLLVVGATACAPEPVAGSVNKESEKTTSPETTWGSGDGAEEELSTTLPESFPSDLFQLPANAVIFNAGERNPEQWFLVLKAADADSAETLWNTIIETNSFATADEIETSEGGLAATLTQGPLTVQAMTIPGADGTVLLSYDINRLF